MKFIDGPDEILKFSSDLTSNERRLVHEVSHSQDKYPFKQPVQSGSLAHTVVVSSYFTAV